jgi:hypothetical protein
MNSRSDTFTTGKEAQRLHALAVHRRARENGQLYFRDTLEIAKTHAMTEETGV